jgi:hypothetical protein
MNSYYFCNIPLEGVKAGALAGTRKATLRNFHIHMATFPIETGSLLRWHVSGTSRSRGPGTKGALSPD